MFNGDGQCRHVTQVSEGLKIEIGGVTRAINISNALSFGLTHSDSSTDTVDSGVINSQEKSVEPCLLYPSEFILKLRLVGPNYTLGGTQFGSVNLPQLSPR